MDSEAIMTFLLDLTILTAYGLYARHCGVKRKNVERSAVCFAGAFLYIVSSWLLCLIFMVGDLAPRYFHLLACSLCFMWSYGMIKYCAARWCAAAILLFGLLQMAYSIEWFRYGQTETWLSDNFTLLALLSHILIIMAAHINGLTLHTSTKRRDIVGVKTT